MQAYPLLESLGGAAHVRLLSDEEKVQLAQELRQLIIETVAVTGGHLAPNLGVIELTIALLATGNFPDDSLIFDVGHQCYAWKILTGRLEAFSSLRQKGGLSGFPKREESDYDVFNTGHSSTSLSAALGLARAKRIRGDHSKTMALIGDGALGGGMAFEALSDAGQSGENLLVILNDNQMCIDQAVGGMSRHLEQLRTSQRYIRMKTVWEVRLGKIPLMGKPLVLALARLKRRWRSWRREAGIIFEQLGFRYYGPVDGHDLPALERHLRALRLVRGPILLHVITTKGKGYCYAEDQPHSYHGVAPFDSVNGQSNGGSGQGPSFSRLLGQTLVELAQEDQRIVAITAAMAQGTGLTPFQEAFPQRFYDVGIAEQHALTMAAGLAVGGLRPFVALYSSFLQRAMDQLIHDICLQKLPVVLLVDRAGLVGGDGDTHQGLYDMAMTLSLPHMTILAPATASDFTAMLHYAPKHQGPLMIRYPNQAASLADYSSYPDPLDQAVLSDFVQLRQISQGQDLTVIALGVTIDEAKKAVDSLQVKHPSKTIDLYSAQSVLPFDYKTMLRSIHKTGRLLLIEDGVESGGFGTLLGAQALRTHPGVLIDYAGVSQPDRGQATRSELIKEEGLDKEGLERRMSNLLGLPGPGG